METLATKNILKLTNTKKLNSISSTCSGSCDTIKHLKTLTIISNEMPTLLLIHVDDTLAINQLPQPDMPINLHTFALAIKEDFFLFKSCQQQRVTTTL